MGQSLSRLEQGRSSNALRDLAPPKTQGHRSDHHDLNRSTLLTALNNVAAYIAKQKHSITVIAVGGAVNTIHLQSRMTTRDVDFFNNDLTVHDKECLLKAVKVATKKDRLLEDDWFNNHTILFIPLEQRGILTKQAFALRETIFSAPGLTVLAAPWEYAFCCKVDRLAGSGTNTARPYDQDDAVQYLARYLSTRRLTKVSKEAVQSWFAQYKLRWTTTIDVVIKDINSAYRKTFNVKPDVII